MPTILKIYEIDQTLFKLSQIIYIYSDLRLPGILSVSLICVYPRVWCACMYVWYVCVYPRVCCVCMCSIFICVYVCMYGMCVCMYVCVVCV